MIRTVCKDIGKENLGWCQCHEHIFIADGPSRKINDALHMQDYGKSCKEVKTYKASGGNSFVDAQPYGCGRMAENLLRLSVETDVNIISCTGFHKLEFFQNGEWLKKESQTNIAELYIKEIETGIFSSSSGLLDAKAGVIKCAAIKNEHRANGYYQKLFEAAAQAAKITGAPVMVHMDEGADAFSVIRFFGDSGVSAEKLMICHLDRTKYDFKYHQEVASTGAYLDYDTIHRNKYHSNEKEADLICNMVSRGYKDNIVLSLDTTNKRLTNYCGDIGLNYILTEFKRFLEQWICRETIDGFMVKNPSKYLDFE